MLMRNALGLPYDPLDVM